MQESKNLNIDNEKKFFLQNLWIQECESAKNIFRDYKGKGEKFFWDCQTSEKGFSGT